jgi:S-formylglutathione hydrolase FrmB
MKKRLRLLALLPLICLGQQQDLKGRIITNKITATTLQNTGGENPTRSVTIYLPPNYEKTSKRYPVIYYLHQFMWNDSIQISDGNFDKLLDKAIATKKIEPVIVIISNQHTLYRGSIYTNSSLTGNWADFTAKELVAYVDKNYRTIPKKESRGIAGHSMGGYGAIKLGMLFPDVFSAVYAMSPGALGLAKEIGPTGSAYKMAQLIKTRDELLENPNYVLSNYVVAMGRAYSPNPNKPPFYADLPFSYKGDKMFVDYKVLDLWNKNSPIEMASAYIDNLKKLRAIKLDWGRNEEYDFIPLTCLNFSEKLESLGINHFAEEYLGTHSNKIWTKDGRALNVMLPFFNSYLKFEETKTN